MSETPTHDCTAIRREARELRKVIRYHERKQASYQRLAGDIGLSAFSRRKYEARAERSGDWLLKAQEAYDRFADAQRREGVPPGCLRP